MSSPRASDIRRNGRWSVDSPPPRVRALVAWYVHERRNGETMADYARAKGIRYDTVKKLARDQRVLQLLDDELRASNAGALRTQQILDMLHRKAVIDHDVRAARVYMECVGGLIPRRQVDVVVRDARLLSYEQLRAELSRALELLDRDQRADAQNVIEASSRPRLQLTAASNNR